MSPRARALLERAKAIARTQFDLRLARAMFERVAAAGDRRAMNKLATCIVQLEDEEARMRFDFGVHLSAP